MPSLSRRRELDGRADRLESEIRDREMIALRQASKRGLPYCPNCQRAFEEKSLYCPRCDKKVMGTVRVIPDKYLDQAQRRAMADAKRRAGL